MKATATYRADGRTDTIRRADGSIYWSFDAGFARAPEPQLRCDSVDWVLPDRATNHRADAAEPRKPEPMPQVTSSADLRKRLGVQGPPQPRREALARHDAAIHAAAGFVSSSKELRARLGRPEPIKPRYASLAETMRPAPAAEAMRTDAAQPSGPVRSAAELRARLGLPRR